MLEPAHYQGREQALVKHTFLDRYLRDALPKLGHYKSFAYVDLFAGPWQAATPDYSDTSFGIALRRMAGAKTLLAKQGIQLDLTAHLVEKNNFDELEHAASMFQGVKIKCYRGQAEDYAAQIAASIPPSAFRFVVIDPKGLPDVRRFRQLIEGPNTEVLLNFMIDFARRFAGTDLVPGLVKWLSTVVPDKEWQPRLDQLAPAQKEEFITNLARDSLVRMGGFDFSPAITVDKVLSDRALYKLIFLTRHPLGLKVFRDAQAVALEVQSQTRSRVKSDRRTERTGQADLWSAAGISDPVERNAVLLAKQRNEAEELMLSYIDDAPEGGILWRMLWTLVLDEKVATLKELKAAIQRWHKEGRVRILGLKPPARTPKDHHYIARGVL